MQKKNKNKNKNSPSHRRRGCIVEIIGFTILRETHTYIHTHVVRGVELGDLIKEV